jgi:hypothetical protein
LFFRDKEGGGRSKTAGAAPRTPPDFLLKSAQKKVSKEKGGPAGSTPVAGISTVAAFLQVTAAALRGEEAKAVFQSTLFTLIRSLGVIAAVG